MSESPAPQEAVVIAFDHRIIEAASQFFQAAEDARRTDLPHRLNVWLAYPEVVNCAFSAELALKGLHWVHHGWPSHGHDLHKLCKALPEARVQELSKYTATYTATAHHLFERVAEVRRTFEHWRYAFEKKQLGVNIGFLRAFAGGAIEMLRRDAPAP